MAALGADAQPPTAIISVIVFLLTKWKLGGRHESCEMRAQHRAAAREQPQTPPPRFRMVQNFLN